MGTLTRFLRGALARRPEYSVDVISLAMSGRDPASLRLLSPRSWLRAPRSVPAIWDGIEYDHVGAWAVA